MGPAAREQEGRYHPAFIALAYAGVRACCGMNVSETVALAFFDIVGCTVPGPCCEVVVRQFLDVLVGQRGRHSGHDRALALAALVSLQ